MAPAEELALAVPEVGLAVGRAHLPVVDEHAAVEQVPVGPPLAEPRHEQELETARQVRPLTHARAIEGLGDRPGLVYVLEHVAALGQLG